MSVRDRLQQLQARASKSAPADIARRFSDNSIMSQAAALSFYTLLSLAPLVLVLLWLSTALYPAAQEQFFQQVGSLGGPRMEETVRIIVENAESEPDDGMLAAMIGLAALFSGASIVFGQLQFTLNAIFRSASVVRAGIWAWIRKRLLSLGMVVTLGFLLVISMVAQAGLELVATRLPSAVPWVIGALSLVVYTLIFAAIFHFVPDCPVDRRRSLVGGAITAALFMVGRALIGLYLGRSDLGSAYGPAGGLVVVLVWIYYCAVVFFIGAIITAVMDTRAARRARIELERRAGGDIPAPTF